MESVIVLFLIRSYTPLLQILYYTLFAADELLNTKFLVHKNGTFERGNFNAVSGGIIQGGFFPQS